MVKTLYVFGLNDGCNISTVTEELLANARRFFPGAVSYAPAPKESDPCRELSWHGEDALMNKVLASFEDFIQGKEYVICEGTSPRFSALTAYELNLRIAAALGTPVVPVMDARGFSADEIEAQFALVLAHARELGCQMAGFYANGADSSVTQELTKTYGLPVFRSIPPLNINIDAVPEHITALFNRAGRHMSPRLFEFSLIQKAQKHPMRIVLPEGEEDRLIKAAAILLERKAAQITLLGNQQKILGRAQELGVSLDGATIIDPAAAPDFEDFSATYAELRAKKGVTIEQAREKMADATYYGTMMIYKGLADGMVSGAINTTAHTVRPALEFIKTRPGASIVSSAFFVCFRDLLQVYGDCAINLDPDPAQLADIAVATAQTARDFGIDPRVAMLSYSTGTSGKGPSVDKVREAARLAKEKAPELALTGPIQYDAAVDPDTAKTKLPGDPVAGRANVFVVPDINTGNNLYKAVQRSAHALAIGPVLQGLRRPVNDLSRGCTVPDIVNTVAITAIQAQAEQGLA